MNVICYRKDGFLGRRFLSFELVREWVLVSSFGNVIAYCLI